MTRSLRRWLLVAGAFLSVFAVTAVLLGACAISDLTDARHARTTYVESAARLAQTMTTALRDQETGVWGYVLTGREDLLESYWAGGRAAAEARAELTELIRNGGPVERASLDVVDTATREWVTGYVEPTLEIVRTRGGPVDFTRGKALFDAVRAALARQTEHYDALRAMWQRQEDTAVATLVTVCVAVTVLLVLVIIALFLGARRFVLKPLTDLRAAQEAHRALDEQARQLQRANTELEQFAYVASHDLQEPLRKIAGFCQLLSDRYRGQLDARADQYIDFAVDGAKRMQVLINDLLEFSRVGRTNGQAQDLDSAELVAQAERNLAVVIEESGARIDAANLPRVRGEASLLTTVFQNLISNAIKFRGDEAPRLRIEARRANDMWEFSCSDNGIGIDPRFAERIFVIFQRLHAREEYPGTGIGLALCRKIIEHHGGTIRLDTGYQGGSRFVFTLPAIPDGSTEGEVVLPL